MNLVRANPGALYWVWMNDSRSVIILGTPMRHPPRNRRWYDVMEFNYIFWASFVVIQFLAILFSNASLPVSTTADLFKLIPTMSVVKAACTLFNIPISRPLEKLTDWLDSGLSKLKYCKETTRSHRNLNGHGRGVANFVKHNHGVGFQTPLDTFEEWWRCRSVSHQPAEDDGSLGFVSCHVIHSLTHGSGLVPRSMGSGRDIAHWLSLGGKISN